MTPRNLELLILEFLQAPLWLHYACALGLIYATVALLLSTMAGRSAD